MDASYDPIETLDLRGIDSDDIDGEVRRFINDNWNSDGNVMIICEDSFMTDSVVDLLDDFGLKYKIKEIKSDEDDEFVEHCEIMVNM